MDDSTSDDANGDDRRVPFAVFVLFEAALAPLALVLGWLLGQRPLLDFAWEGRAVVSGLLAALPMLALLAAAWRWPVGPLKSIKEFFDRELVPALEGCGWLDLALISVAAGVGEEMLFRGVIQGALARLLGPVVAIVAASTLFGLLHPVSTAYVLIAGFLGAYLGFVWLETGNLLSVMVTHAVYDFIALLVMLHDRRETAARGSAGR